MRGERPEGSERPVMVLRYNPWRKAAFLCFWGICFTFFFIIFLGSKKYSYKIFSFFCFLIDLWLILDISNTDRIEIYKDRIGQIRKIELPLPLFKKKIIFFKNSEFFRSYIGVEFIEFKRKFWPNPFIIVYTDIFSSEDRKKFASFFSKLSGWPETEFRSGFYYIKKPLLKGGKK